VDSTDAKAPKLARVATPAKSVTATARLPERTVAVRLAPDGKTVYALVGTDDGGELIAFDSARLTQTRLIPLRCAPADLAVADGKAFVSDIQRGTVTLVDVKAKFAEVATWDGFPANARLTTTADGATLYTAAAAGSSYYVDAWQLPTDSEGRPKKTARSFSTAATVRLSPDGGHIVLPNGTAYRAPK
jgi:DNA-binding beta-propeller fold protein YncE